jgi:hypothetical protein
MSQVHSVTHVPVHSPLSVLRTCVTKQTKDLRYIGRGPFMVPELWSYARTLKEETTRPAALTLRLQQKKFDRFRQVFNYERPHEGLNNATPGSIYQPSSVLLPRNLVEFVYPHGFMLRRVNNSGDISWHKGRVFISEVFRFELLGFEQVDENFYKVYFRDVEIGEFDAEALRFRPAQIMR